METWSSDRYESLGIPGDMKQDNVSCSKRGVLRGLHYQEPNPQGKLVYVLSGAIFDVAVDIRLGSPTFGRWVGLELSQKNLRQLYVPEGFAHGFCVLSDVALVAYKCTSRYRKECDKGLLWNDPEIAIHWPVAAPILSPRDASLRPLKFLAARELPRYRGDG